jgi:putative addiction module component (TIGR02574 family)
MDLTSVLREVNSWPVEDRVRLVHEVWDQLVEQGVDPDLTHDLKAELDRRLTEDEVDPHDVVAWADVKAAALKRARS